MVANYSRIVHASYSDALRGAERLSEALATFVESPDEDGLRAAKEAWIEARRPYLQTEAYRFYAGPIDDANGPEPMINGWPLDEFYIDGIEGAPDAGIVNDPDLHPEITKERIARLNEKAGETAITSGYHAVEFLLWGQDRSDDGPGERSVSDYVDAANADRRGRYLIACGDLLVDHLSGLVEDWAPDDGDNFRARFEAKDPLDAVGELVYGLRVMTGKELAGERLLVAWDTQDQEDEHSCFSDTTHLDHRLDLLGIENVFRGVYRDEAGETVSGPGVAALVAALRPERSEEFDRALAEAKRTVHAIPAPFDQAVLGGDDAPGRRAILDAVVALEDFAALLAEVEQWIADAR